ncbi:MAG TPA: AAA family ATPase [Tepidisphaeraceae bacterium]|jgi:adenylate kinase family enzyme|nr:AAA family ATPase [Tepidisphaeraceae bacterium]
MHRIVVLGTSGSGKTTLARELARRLGVSHIELDEIHWKPNWTSTPTDEFRAAVAPLVARPGWTLDGNYKRLRDLIWSRADTLIWLDYPMSITFMRLLWRTMSRSVRGTPLWNGNRESLWLTFCSRDSILLWAITQWRRNRREMPGMLAERRSAGKRVIRFRTPGQAERWLQQIGEPADQPSSAAAASSSLSRVPAK